MNEDLYQRGMQIRRAVLGDEYVDKSLAAPTISAVPSSSCRPSTAGAACGDARVSRGGTAAC
jgi:hypothetical protein